jgi:hypothetical protein
MTVGKMGGGAPTVVQATPGSELHSIAADDRSVVWVASAKPPSAGDVGTVEASSVTQTDASWSMGKSSRPLALHAERSGIATLATTAERERGRKPTEKRIGRGPHYREIEGVTSGAAHGGRPVPRGELKKALFALFEDRGAGLLPVVEAREEVRTCR